LRIKTLTLQGFKSFADKEIISFNKGISCIVGPNGSGKSNILDAIKWIMGEQNVKELRGGDIDDILFNGSKTREPSNVASATLTLTDLEDAISEKWGVLSEISITRKYYRTGEREYYINNKNCRLKDIKEFFYDVGVSYKSIILIEQGKVDKIVQADPEELREIFEEFSGIINYKDKKKEAQKKLEHTKNNLERIKDIYIEVEENKKLFTIQIDELKKYKQLVNDKKIIHKTVFSINYKNILDGLGKLSEAKKILFERKLTVENEHTMLLKLYNEKLSKLNTLEKEYEVMKERSYIIRNEIDKNKNQKKLTDEKIFLYKEESFKIKERIKILKVELNEKIEKQRLLKDSLDKLHTEFLDIKNNKEKLDFKQRDLSKCISEKQNKAKEINKKIYKLMDEAKRIDQSLYEKDIYVKNIEKELMRIKKEKEYIETEKNDYVNRINDILIREGNINEKYQDLKTQYNNKQIEINKIKSTYDKECSKLNDMNNIKRDFENRSVLLKNLIEQTIIGESKEYKKFIDQYPFTTLIDRIELKNTSEVICYGDIIIFKDEIKKDLIDMYDKEYWPIKFIFENELEVFLNKIKMNPVNSISRNLIYNGLYYIGKKMNDSRENLMKYKEELKILEMQKVKVDNEISSIKKLLDNITNKLQVNESSLQEDLKQINEVTIMLEKLKNERSNYDREINKLIIRYTTVEKDENRLVGELTNYRLLIEKEISNKNNTNSLLLDLDNEYKAIRSNIDEINKEYIDLNDILMNLTIKYREISKELEISDKMYNENKINIDKLSNEQYELENKLRKYDELLIESEKLLVEIEEKIVVLKKNNESINEYNNNIMLEIEDLNSNIKEIKTQIDKFNCDIKELEMKYNKYLINEAKLLSDKDNLEIQYMQLYNISINDEFSNYYKNENLKELNEKLLNIEAEINNLGPINMGAEIEYKKLEDRSLFLKNQIKDLEGAMEKITEMIYNFDKESINRFNNTFHEVKENFKKVVKILFNGGSADIKVLKEEDLLNSGIEIYIQPPGKKLQNMNLLSGGEKALMSCALLFAFFLYRKAPFCFLDEVDAPLDDANIGRFLHIVKTLSTDTQFFIISHNYNTMLESDNIYGITMKEPGVSGIYSLKKEDLSVV
jgi:chromosome segregation protein